MILRFSRVAGLVLTGLAAASPVFAGITVIINPQDPHRTPIERTYPSASATIRLDAGEEALIYYDDQTMDRVTGPFNGPLSQLHADQVAKDSLLGRLGKVFARADDRAVNVGAARGAGLSAGSSQNVDWPPASLPAGIDPLDVSLDTSQTQCFLTAPLHLWQTNTPAGAKIVLSRVGGGAQELTLDPTTSRLTWPKDVRPEEGTYVVSYLDAPRDAPGKTHTFAFKRLVVSDPDNYTVADLVAAGCDYQATVKAKLLIKAQNK